MNYIIDESSKTPTYLQLYKHIRDDIIGNVYPYKTKLPSKRTLATETGVSTVTVEHAYALLCDEGYVEARERSGYFVIFRSSDNFMSAPEQQTLRVMKQNNDVHDEFPFSVFSRTMRKVISDYGEALLIKSPNEGCLELRGAIARYLARNRGIHVDTKQIIIGSGAEYIYGLIVELIGRDRIYAIESPSYRKIEQVYRAADVRYELLPLVNDGIDSTALAQTSAEVLHTTPYRSFPSGVTATASKRYEYIRWSDKNNRFIVEDDFESEFSVSKSLEETLFALSEHDNVIYMNTFSKTISPSLRVAYMVIPECLVNVFYEKLGFYSCTVPTFEQLVLAELILNGDFERHINKVRRNKRKNQL